MSKNLLLCAVNSKYVHSSLAVHCLKSCIDIQKYSCDIYETTINEDMQLPLDEITRKSPDIIGFSCYIWNITRVLSLCEHIKKELPDCILILGGPQVSYNSRTVLNDNAFVDYIICGEGEQPLPYLLDCIESSSAPDTALGISFRKNGEIFEGKPFVSDAPTASPYDEQYLSSLSGRIAYIETSRGCPFSCAFCLSGRCGSVRFFDMERVKKEILLLANSGTKTVKFVDRTFNANKARAVEIFNFIIKNFGTAIPRGVCFHFEIGGDLLDDETLMLLKGAPRGLFQLEIGFQSFNEKTLRAINRKTNTNKLYDNVKALTSFGNMHIHTDLIAGLPYEDMKSFEQTFEKAYSLDANMLQLGFLKLLYGAPMREEHSKYPCSYSPLPPYEVISTPYMSEGELHLLHLTEDALERLYNSGRFRRSLKYLTQECNIKPFQLFTSFGKYIGKSSTGISLDAYTSLFIDFFSKKETVDSSILRDRLVCDRLCTNKSGKLPAVLKLQDSRFKAIKKAMAERSIISCAVLGSTDEVVYADYNNFNPVCGEYQLHTIPVNSILS